MLLNDDGSYTADPNGLFRDLTAEEVKEFQAAARDQHKPPFPVIKSIYHPVYQAECRKIEKEFDGC